MRSDEGMSTHVSEASSRGQDKRLAMSGMKQEFLKRLVARQISASSRAEVAKTGTAKTSHRERSTQLCSES